MANKDTLKNTVSFKVNNEQLDYIKELKADGVDLRKVLEYYRINNTSERKKLENKERYLINLISELEIKLDKSREELKEVRVKLNKAPTEDQLTLEIVEGLTILNERVKLKYGAKASIERARDWLNTNEADRVLAPVIRDNNINDVDKFKEELLKQAKF